MLAGANTYFFTDMADGFESTFTFQINNAARLCKTLDDLGAGARSPAVAERRRALRRNVCFQGCQRVCQREKRVAN